LLCETGITASDQEAAVDDRVLSDDEERPLRTGLAPRTAAGAPGGDPKLVLIDIMSIIGTSLRRTPAGAGAGSTAELPCTLACTASVVLHCGGGMPGRCADTNRADVCQLQVATFNPSRCVTGLDRLSTINTFKAP